MGFQGDMAELVDATDLKAFGESGAEQNFEPFLKNQKSESSQIQRNDFGSRPRLDNNMKP